MVELFGLTPDIRGYPQSRIHPTAPQSGAIINDKSKKGPNKLNNKGIIFIELDTIGGITLDRVNFFCQIPYKNTTKSQ